MWVIEASSQQGVAHYLKLGIIQCVTVVGCENGLFCSITSLALEQSDHAWLFVHNKIVFWSQYDPIVIQVYKIRQNWIVIDQVCVTTSWVLWVESGDPTYR